MGNTVRRRQRKRNLQERNKMCGNIEKYVWLREERMNLLIRKEWEREREGERSEKEV